MKFIALVEKPWSTLFVILEQNTSSLSLNMPIGVCGCAFAMTDAGLIPKFSRRGGKGIGGWSACANELQKSVRDLKFSAVQPQGRWSNYQFQVVLRSRFHRRFRL